MLDMFSTGKEIREANPDTVILPIGSTEQHGPHLPVATDTLIADMVAQGMAEKLNAVRLYTVPVTTSMEHRDKKGSVWVTSPVLYQYLESILDSLHEQGYKRVIMVVTHGGVMIANPLTREINHKYPDMHVVCINPSLFTAEKEIQDLLESKVVIHACEVETSLLLYKYPEQVRRELIEDCVPEVSNDYMDYRPIFQYSANGVWGSPSFATAEKGEKILKVMIDKSVELAEQAFAQGF